MTVLAILQARVTSTRLPNKVLAPILGQPMLARQIERLRRATTLDNLVVATSDDASDDPLVAMCEDIGVPFYRGSLNDVLARFKGACEAFGSANHIVRLTGDCPLADPAVIDAVVRHHLASDADYTSNALQPTWPDGLDVEVLRMETLNRIFDEAHLPSEREHVTSYIYKNPEFFYIEQFKSERDLSHFRWTVDESADLVFVSEVYAALYPKNPAFDMTDVLTLIEQCPGLAKLNDHFLRNEGYAKSLATDTPNIPSN
jgi:spore coat polysaccharide biosynthesis protein SpsF